MTNLTKAQRALLLDMSDAVHPHIYCNSSYKPAIKLVELGYASWFSTERLQITQAGRDALK